MLITFSSPDLIDLRNALHNFARRGVSYASRNALNATAFEGRSEWKSQVEERMILRNTWTTRSLRVARARGRNVDTMRATLGSVAPYMAVQESGGTETKRGSRGVPIPTSVASGEGRRARPRRRNVRRPNRLGRIELTGTRRARTRRQRNAIAVRSAIAEGRRFVFLELRRGAGIFRIAGRRARPRLDMLWDLSRSSVRIPATKTLERTLEAILPRLPELHARAILEQLRRNGVTRF